MFALYDNPQKIESNANVDQITTQTDFQDSLKIGECGPTLLEDFHFREKMTHFDHERIPERVVHARGFGAHGYFENYESLADVTCADLFQRTGQRTDVFVRFSTVLGNKGSPDLPRDIRGFATKFYTAEGNWDLVGNNAPVFFVQDAIKFPDLIHAAKPEPDKEFPQASTAHDNFWDFVSLMPESLHAIMWAMSDRAIPRSFRFMEGFGVHTFRLVNKAGQSTFVKFHWKPRLVLWDEALKVNGFEPDFHRRDLREAIESGHFPEWELGLQLFDQKFADSLPFDVLDATKLIPEEQLPIRIVGRLVLNKNVDNFFLETEQVAFCTANIPPGIDFTNDPLLQGRNFSYLDTQLKRLGGPNFNSIPINAPKGCPVFNFQQDGHHATKNPNTRVNYEPNSWGKGVGESAESVVRDGFRSFPSIGKEVSENLEKTRRRPASFADHYSQARLFYISQTKNEQAHISSALIFELSKCLRLDIRDRMVSHLKKIDRDLGERVRTGLGCDDSKGLCTEATDGPTYSVEPAPSLSIMQRAPKSFEGRKVGIIVTDGVNDSQLALLQKQFSAVKCTYEIIAMNAGVVKTRDQQSLGISFLVKQLHGAPSVVYDAVAVLATGKGIEMLMKYPPALQFVSDAFHHLKFIGYSSDDCLPLFAKAGIAKDELDGGCFCFGDESQVTKFMVACNELRYWKRESLVFSFEVGSEV